MESSPLLRPATPADFDAILALNAASVAALSPLDAAGLAALHAQAACHWVVEGTDGVEAVLIALGPGQPYASPNYRWFEARGEPHLYVDRVIVDARARRRGHARRLYAALFEHARMQRLACITCEFDLQPPNPASQRFHAAWGFREIGRQQLASGKTVSMQRAPLPEAAADGHGLKQRRDGPDTHAAG